MAHTKTELYNLAAQVLGNRGRLVTTLQTSRVVQVFDTWYDVARRIVLGGAHWPSCLRIVPLPLFKERSLAADWMPGDPAPGSRYAYMTPSDMLRPRALSSGGHFTLGKIGDTACLFTHQEKPILLYTFDETNISQWEEELFLAVVHALAAFGAMPLTGKKSYVDYAEAKANQAILLSRNAAANTDEDPQSIVAPWHAARGYDASPTPYQYVFPYGGLISVGESANVQ